MTPKQLMRAVEDRKCVTGVFSGKHMPAAFLVSMQFRIVMRNMARIKLYRPKNKKPKKQEIPYIQEIQW